MPISNTAAMPTETWNKERRNKRDSGKLIRRRIGEGQRIEGDSPHPLLSGKAETAHRRTHSWKPGRLRSRAHLAMTAGRGNPPAAGSAAIKAAQLRFDQGAMKAPDPRAGKAARR